MTSDVVEELVHKEALLPPVIAREIKRTIIKDQLAPGTKLPNEATLIATYGVSRPTLREAIKILLAENVVEIQRGKGTFVTGNPGIGKDPLGLDFSNQKNLIKNLFETRLLIEPPIARLAALRRTENDLDNLRAALSAFTQAPGRTENHAELDVVFHTTIARSSSNDVLYRILPIIIETIQRGSTETYDVEASHKRALIFHSKLYEAITEQKGELAETLMRDHIIEAAEDAKVILSIIT